MGIRLFCRITALLLLFVFFTLSGCTQAPASSSLPSTTSPSSATSASYRLLSPESAIDEFFFEEIGYLAPVGEFYPASHPDSIPAPQLSPKQSTTVANPSDGNVILYVVEGDEEVAYPVPLESEGSFSSYASDSVLAVAGGDIASYRYFITMVSHDGGQSWIRSEFESGHDIRLIDMGFSTPQDGYLIFRKYDEDEMARTSIFITSDGGASWNKKCAFASESFGIGNFFFASPDVGWMIIMEQLDDPDAFSSTLYETLDGGASWYPVHITLPQAMTDNLDSMSLSPPRWSDNQWLLNVSLKWWGTWLWAGFSFGYDASQDTWTWNEPEWQLPEGANKVRFMAYIDHFYMPESYDLDNITQQDLDFISEIHWVSESGEFMKLTGKWSPEYIAQLGYPAELMVPAYEVQKLVEYWYGVPNFDVSLLSGYRADQDAFAGDIHHGHGLMHFPRTITDISILQNGDIAVTIDCHTPFSSDGGPMVYVDDIQTQQCVFRFLEAEGAQFFTLISSQAKA